MQKISATMLSDETFPQDLQIDDEDNEIFQSISTTRSETRSLENLNSYFSAENSGNSDNSTEINVSLIESSTIGLLIRSSAQDFERLTNSTKDPEKQQQHPPEASFNSITESARKFVKIPPPKAPIKKRKSYSCHDLQLKKNNSNNYDHVESKVKKLIQDLAPEDRRKPFARTKSMPACAMQAPPIDENNSEDVSSSKMDLMRDIRKKMIKIYELEEKVETKDHRIIELQLEKAKMRMIFDDLRGQIEVLKDIEAKYNQMKVFSPSKSQKSVLIQTEVEDTSQEPLLASSTSHHLMPRHLTFTGDANFTQDFSMFNNNSTDNLIPMDSEIQQSVPNEVDQDLNTSASTLVDVDKKKKSKKRFRLFKLMQCISGKTQE